MAVNIRPTMPITTRLNWSNSSSVMYIGIPSFHRREKKRSPSQGMGGDNRLETARGISAAGSATGRVYQRRVRLSTTGERAANPTQGTVARSLFVAFCSHILAETFISKIFHVLVGIRGIRHFTSLNRTIPGGLKNPPCA